MLSQLIGLCALAILPALLLWAATSDLLTMTIPNRLSVVLATSYFLLAPLCGLPLSDLGWSVIAALAVFLICFALFAMNVMGGGDAKLLTAASLWFGLSPSLASFLIAVAYAGGVVTLLFLLLRAGARVVTARGISLPHSIVGTKKIPYGLAIAIGGLLTYFQSPIAQRVLSSF
jgi:prepilin peptidase CpaA